MALTTIDDRGLKTPIDLLDNEKIRFGTGNDLEIYHNGTNSIIHDTTSSNLNVKTSRLTVVNQADNETMLKCQQDGAVELYYDNNKKLETDTDGVQVTGYLQAHHNSSDSDYTDHDWHVLQSQEANKAAVIFEHSNNAQPFGLLLDFSDSAPNDHTYYFINATDNVETKFKVWSDGDVVNDDNSYGSTSDVKLKENIVDAGSQWDDVKAVKVRNFNFKKNKSKKLLGVVAQEIETISPGLVDNNTDMDKYNNDLGTTTKSVKYSILYMKAFKALQEAMAKIETLETKVAALEAA